VSRAEAVDPYLELKRRFEQRLCQDRRRIEALLDALEASPQDVGAERAELLRLCHGLAGTAGSFGYGSLGAVAARMEALLEARPEPVGLPLAELRRLAGRLHLPGTWGDDRGPTVSGSREAIRTAGRMTPAPDHGAAGRSAPRRPA